MMQQGQREPEAHANGVGQARAGPTLPANASARPRMMQFTTISGMNGPRALEISGNRRGEHHVGHGDEGRDDQDVRAEPHFVRDVVAHAPR